MFRVNPDYIVAGEIVKTTRMYAMSVSPLPYSVLAKISPALAAGLGQHKRRRGEGFARGFAGAEKEGGAASDEAFKPRRDRDYTNNIRIGSEVFEIETVKGKKQVILPWEKLKAVMRNISPEAAAMYRKLRGVVVVEGKYSLLAGERLPLILSLAPSLESDFAGINHGGFEEAASQKRFRPAIGILGRRMNAKQSSTLNSSQNLDELLETLPYLVRPTLWKKEDKSLRKKERENSSVGFAGLFTDGKGNYWIRRSRGFRTSLNESLASVETLIDELRDDVDIEKKHIVNQCYRRLSDYLRLC
jgi:hypothetical protein